MVASQSMLVLERRSGSSVRRRTAGARLLALLLALLVERWLGWAAVAPPRRGAARRSTRAQPRWRSRTPGHPVVHEPWSRHGSRGSSLAPRTSAGRADRRATSSTSGLGRDRMNGVTTTSGVSPREWSVPPSDVLLADGTIAVIRTLRGRRPRGGAATSTSTSPRTPCGCGSSPPNRNAGRQYVARLFDPDHTERFALVALVRGRLAGLATAEVLSEERAEVAFLVSDQDRGRGLGSLLLEHLAALGREHGLTRFDADVLADNYGMLRVFRGAGFSVARRTEHGEVSVELRTDVSAAALDAVGPARVALRGPLAAAAARARERGRGRRTTLGRAASAAPCSTPSSRAGTPGGCRSCTPRPTARAARSPGCRRTRACAAVPGPVDLVMVVVPPDEVGEVIADACAAGVGAAVVVSSGFSGTAGHDRPTATCVELARAPQRPAGRPELPGRAQPRRRRARSTRRSRGCCPSPAGWPSRRSRAGSASRCSTSRATSASACTRSSRSAPSSTCRATTCWPPGATTTACRSGRCTSSRSATR